MSTNYGELMAILGPMFSSKSTELISMIDRDMCQNIPIAVCKYKRDTRYGNENRIYTHNQYHTSCISILSLYELPNDLKYNIKTLYIDEAQFFPSLLEPIQEYLQHGVNVVIAGLKLDYKNEPFSVIAELMPYATIINKSSICYFCKGKAFGSRLKFPELDIHKLEQGIAIGGAESWIPCCFRQQCWSEGKIECLGQLQVVHLEQKTTLTIYLHRILGKPDPFVFRLKSKHSTGHLLLNQFNHSQIEKQVDMTVHFQALTPEEEIMWIYESGNLFWYKDTNNGIKEKISWMFIDQR